MRRAKSWMVLTCLVLTVSGGFAKQIRVRAKSGKAMFEA